MRTAVLAALALCALLIAGCDSTGVSWHSYVHPSGQIHYSLHLASYRRGIFFGSCGPSTYSLQWEYRIDLQGAGPGYTRDAITLQDGDFHRLMVDSGAIVLDLDRKSAKIDLAVLQDSKARPFPHNGIFTMSKEP